VESKLTADLFQSRLGTSTFALFAPLSTALAEKYQAHAFPETTEFGEQIFCSWPKTTKIEEENSMKRILAVAVLVLATASLALGQMGDKQAKTKAAGTSVEQTLMQIEHDWTNAALKKDSAALDKILADEWVGQGPTGTETKAQTLAELKSGDSKLDSQTLGDLKVRVFGNTAVVTGSDDEKSSYKGKDTSGHWIWTDVFVKRQGRWQAVASQGTLIAKQ
jgi:hypothetical protein